MEKRLESLDLNLLLTLHWVLSERNVTAAAEKLGQSQPATSRALGRLREIFGDPLLVKVGGEMAPTPLAVKLQPAVAHAIETCREVLRVSGPFDPGAQTGNFRIACSDYIGSVVAACWAESIRPFAPGLVLDLFPPEIECAREMITGRVDMCILPDARVLDLPPTVDPDQYVQKEIGSHDFVCAVRADHPLASRKITEKDYFAHDHIVIAPEQKDDPFLTTYLKRMGKERRMAYRVSSFMLALPILQYTDCIVTVPRPLISMAPEGLHTFPVPFELAAMSMYAVWHPNWTHDQRHKWVRDKLFDIISKRDGCRFGAPGVWIDQGAEAKTFQPLAS